MESEFGKGITTKAKVMTLTLSEREKMMLPVFLTVLGEQLHAICTSFGYLAGIDDSRQCPLETEDSKACLTSLLSSLEALEKIGFRVVVCRVSAELYGIIRFTADKRCVLDMRFADLEPAGTSGNKGVAAALTGAAKHMSKEIGEAVSRIAEDLRKAGDVPTPFADILKQVQELK